MQSKALALLQQVQHDLTNALGNKTSIYAAKGRLLEVEEVLKGEYVHGKRENDASKSTRQEVAAHSPSQRKGSRGRRRARRALAGLQITASTGSTSPDEGQKAPTISPPAVTRQE